MAGRIRKNGFSLVEVMLAAGILAIGFMLIATVFPVGIKLTATATERTIAAVAADEAFAKVRLYGVDPSMLGSDYLVDFASVVAGPGGINETEFIYPSTTIQTDEMRYYWSALCRQNTNGTVQVMVFVSRKTGAGVKFPDPDDPCNPVSYPKPFVILREDDPCSLPGELFNEITIDDPAYVNFVTDDSILVDTKTGLIMRVLGRNGANIRLAEPVVEYDLGNVFWVVPPAIGGGRNPCIGVYPGEF